MVQYIRVCEECFRTDARRCARCGGRGVVSLLPALELRTGARVYLEIVEEERR